MEPCSPIMRSIIAPKTPLTPSLPVAPAPGNPFVAPAARDPVVGDIDRQIAEITARTGKDPGERYAELTTRFGAPRGPHARAARGPRARPAPLWSAGRPAARPRRGGHSQAPTSAT